MTLKELLKIVDSEENVQVCIRMFGSVFKTTRWASSYMRDEEAEELLEKKVKTVRTILDDETETMRIDLE